MVTKADLLKLLEPHRQKGDGLASAKKEDLLTKCMLLNLLTNLTLDNVKRTRPDKAEHAAHKKTVLEKCVKMKLNTICKSDALGQAIREAVQSQTQMAVEASRLCNLHVLECLANDEPVDIPSSSYFRNALCCVSAARKGREPTDARLQAVYNTLYKPLRPADSNIPCRDGQRQMTTYLSQQMYTNARTMVSCHLLKRLQKFVALEVVGLTLQPGKDFRSRHDARNVNKVVGKIIDGFIKGEAYVVAATDALGDSATDINDWVHSLMTRFQPLFPIKRVKSRWTEYMPLLHHISSRFESHVEQRQKAKLNCKKGIRLFSMLPVADLVAKHIRIDTSALQELAKHAGLKRTDSGVWDEYFLARKLVEGIKKNPNRTFGRMIDTDGVAVSLHFERPKRNDDSVNDEDDEPVVQTSEQAETKYIRETKKLDTMIKNALIPDDITLRAAIDPGGNTMAHCVLEGDCQDDKRVVECTTALYRHMASMDRLLQRRKHLLKSSGLETQMCQTPTPRGSTVASMQDHLQDMLSRLPQLLKHHGSSRYLNMAFTGYSRKTQAMEKMADSIAPRCEKVLLVYGAADFPHAMKGNIASAYKRLKKTLALRSNVKLVEVGECNTSQKCCQCHQKMKNAKKEVVIGNEISQESIYAVKVCPHCSTTWNRDLNASRNIAHIFNVLRSGKERPEVFRPQRNQSRERGLSAVSSDGCLCEGPLHIQP